MTMQDSRKATFLLPLWIIEDLHQAVERGASPSISALVREALEKRLRELKDEQLRLEFSEAARDKDFLQDLEEMMGLYEEADIETARLIKQ
ncbi:MAG: hypothetical protein AB2L14_21520 [Candidatus Xenobiia bacterium LiM19]